MSKQWVKIAEAVAELKFGANNICEIAAGNRTVCVAKHDNKLYAIAPKCPHASGEFIYGSLDGNGNIICPVHRYKFNIINGRNTSGEGYYLKHWPVEVREDGVYVEMEKASLLGL